MPQHRRLFLFTISSLTFLEFLHTMGVVFVSAQIMGGIAAGPEEYSMAATIYACVAVVMITLHRWFVERLGYRNFLQLSLALFAAGALVCAAADSIGVFIAGRLLMACGAPSFMLAARLFVNVFPPSPARFTGIRFFASGLASGIAAAPWLAANAISIDRWQAVFWGLALVSLAIACLAHLSLPESLGAKAIRTQSHPVVLMALISGSFLFLYALQRSVFDFYSDAGFILACAGLAIAALFYFVRSDGERPMPLIHFNRLRQLRYIVGVGLFTLCYVFVGANTFLLPLFLQRGMSLPSEVAADAIAIGSLGGVAAWAVISKVLPRWPSPRKFLVSGFLMLALFGIAMSRLNGLASLWSDVVPAAACFNAFLILVMSTTAMQTFRDLHDDTAFSHGYQIKNMLGQFGIAAGISVANLLLQSRSAFHSTHLADSISLANPSFGEATHLLGSQFAAAGDALSAQLSMAQIAQLASQQATLLAGIDIFFLIGCLGLALALIMGVQRAFK
jgi:MFS family permease